MSKTCVISCTINPNKPTWYTQILKNVNVKQILKNDVDMVKGVITVYGVMFTYFAYIRCQV